MPSASRMAEGSSRSAWQADPVEASTPGQASSTRPGRKPNRTLRKFGPYTILLRRLAARWRAHHVARAVRENMSNGRRHIEGRPRVALRKLPSVDAVLRAPAASEAVDRFGRTAVVEAVRATLGAARAARSAHVGRCEPLQARSRDSKQDAQPNLRPVFNLTGTVLHTNLGRALIAEEAVEAAVAAMRNAVALEFDLASGRRGERDDHLRGLLCELTGAEDATVVNNNAAAVLIVLNTLALGREAIVSRGELIEIGGAFRMPDIMARAGAKLVEVGTTNRTHPKDYVAAIGSETGLILKVHTSNYRIEGFTREVGPRELAAIARERKVPMVHDLGSGTLDRPRALRPRA